MVLLAPRWAPEVVISLRTQQAIANATARTSRTWRARSKSASQELTAVGSTDREQLQNYVRNLHNKGMEVSIASSENLIINSSNPQLIGASLNPRSKQVVINEHLGAADARRPASYDLVPMTRETTVYLIPVVVEDHLMGYVQVIANFGDYTELLRQARTKLITLALVIFAVGIVFSYALAYRYTRPINLIAAAAQNIAARGLEPVPEVRRRDEIGLLTRSFNEMVAQLRRAREREQELNRLERFTALGQLAGGLAHEIKNPLHFISLAVDQIRTRYAGQLNQERENFLRQIAMIKGEIHRTSGLIQNFLHYGKPIEIRTAPTDLRAIVSDVLALSESRLKSQGIEVVESNGCDSHGAQRRRRKDSHLLPQCSRQRHPGDARRRQAQDRLCAAQRRVAGELCRHRGGHRARGRGPRVRAVLYHQARRHRNRTVPVQEHHGKTRGTD